MNRYQKEVYKLYKCYVAVAKSRNLKFASYTTTKKVVKRKKLTITNIKIIRYHYKLVEKGGVIINV